MRQAKALVLPGPSADTLRQAKARAEASKRQADDEAQAKVLALSDGAIIDAIVRAIDPRPGDAMVEIGPGLAALTQPLVERLGRLTVIDLDRDLAARLGYVEAGPGGW